MIKLLIADDEPFILDALAHSIDWAKLGVEVIATASNGIEAYNHILDLYPDVVMTDIKMPGLSGLELIHKIHEIDSNIQFIILSGYAEFEFAQQAMQYGVTQYLLKPCNEQAIIRAIQLVKQKITSYSTSTEYESDNRCIHQQIKEYVIQYLGDSSLSLKFIGNELMFMNTDYLSRTFHKETGMRFSAYLTKTRIETAKRLMMQNPYLTVQEIAEQVGFGNNPQYFSSVFKKEVGITPSNFQKQSKKKYRLNN